MQNKEDILAKWMSGEISDAELEASQGSDALRELKHINQEVDQWSLPKYNTEDGYQKMQERLQHKTSKNEGSKLLKILVALSVISFLLYGLFLIFGTQTEKLKAEPGQEVNYAFHDGSEVWINDGSSIEYKTSDWSTQRMIELQGEAFFEVSKGSPFTVNTSNGSITVLGTQFNVRAWGNNLYVECFEGRVQVQSGQQLTVLTALESVNIIDGILNANQVINNISPSWQNGMSRFYEEKLTIVCNELERQYHIKVDLKAADRTFSGNFNHDDLYHALRSICKPLNLNYTISKDKKSAIIE